MGLAAQFPIPAHPPPGSTASWNTTRRFSPNVARGGRLATAGP